MAKLIYEKPKAEFILFDNSDVITTSVGECPSGMADSCGSVQQDGGVGEWWENRGGCVFVINRLWAPECTGPIHKKGSEGCWLFNGAYSVGGDEW